jgi:hypothetical protein
MSVDKILTDGYTGVRAEGRGQAEPRTYSPANATPSPDSGEAAALIGYYLGVEVTLLGKAGGGWYWAEWPDGRRFKHWPTQLSPEPWGPGFAVTYHGFATVPRFVQA